MQNEISKKIHAEILKLISRPKTDQYGRAEKMYRNEVAEKILKICMENKFIYITGTSVVPFGDNEEDNVVSFSRWDRGSIEVEKAEMQIYRYALSRGYKITKKGGFFKGNKVCFNPHNLQFSEKYLQEGWKNNKLTFEI